VNLILEREPTIKFYTDLDIIFSAMNMSPAEYDWFISDVETNRTCAELPEKHGWISGEVLQGVIAGKSLQWIWGVLSAFPKGTKFKVVNVPYADGNPHFWNSSEVSKQIPEALFEIVCWDSSATIFIGIDQASVRNLQAKFLAVRYLGQ